MNLLEEHIREQRMQKQAGVGNLVTEVSTSILNPISESGSFVSGLDRGSRGSLIGLSPTEHNILNGGSNLIETGIKLAAMVAALSTKRRTKAEQKEYDSSYKLRNLIPGVGTYNALKRMGSTLSKE